MGTRYTFEPDYAVAPGATLKELLDTKGISQVDLSMRTGLAMKTINQIVSGVAPLSIETAGRLEMALGVPAQFWNRLELNYRETLARTEATGRLEQVAVPIECSIIAYRALMGERKQRE